MMAGVLAVGEGGGTDAGDCTLGRCAPIDTETGDTVGRELTNLNNNNNLDFISSLHNLPNADPDTCIYSNIDICSSFHDVDSFIGQFKNNELPLFLNLNIQSINAKFDKLKDLMCRLSDNDVTVDVIALQEVWQVKYLNLIDLPGYQKLIFKSRSMGRGGGVGFYVRDGIIAKTVTTPFNSFTNKIFESLTIEITIEVNGQPKQYILSNVYRSPTLVANYTVTEQYDEFFHKFDTLCMYLNSTKKNVYIFLDSNINLLDIGNNNTVCNYFDIICNNGFLVTNHKATRMCNNSTTLIDHILTNVKVTKLCSGSIIDDISDHWITFTQC
jgi:hypothetical protein